ncbi:MAG: dTMP kinase [Spirochaetales bacterium]|nr:dTMP kinase [Spirochaetales bacterium]
MEILENFIVLEGLDGSGTTTQLQMAADRLKKTGKPYFITFEPTESGIGKTIRNILKGREIATPWTIALLFSADRYEHVFHKETGIRTRHENGEIIVCDRYLFSSLAYQSVENDYERVFKLNADFPLPGRLIFIDTPLDVCLRRMSGRTEKEIFEETEFQKKVLDCYNRILKDYAHSGMQIHRIDGTQSREQVANLVWKIIGSLPIMKT